MIASCKALFLPIAASLLSGQMHTVFWETKRTQIYQDTTTKYNHKNGPFFHCNFDTIIDYKQVTALKIESIPQKP
jgi:hypothetical protein